jgi:predicted hotdog family 3-hydroxylacyl-ACP dehydratase
MLSHDDIARRIPHQGRMCLLDRVVAWDAQRIDCEAASHRAPDHPLRAHGRLGIACGIEYAAQAMAVHGALVAEAAGGTLTAPRAGYLASVRAVRLHASRLDDVPEDLAIHAARVMGDAHTIVYDFQVGAAGRALLSGRATVVLDAFDAARQRRPENA